MKKSTPISPVQIVEAKYSEYPSLVNLWERSVRHTHLFLQQEDILYYKNLIKDDLLSRLQVYCIKLGNLTTGFLAIDQHRLEMLFIDPDYLFQGFGTLLLSFALKRGVLEVDVNEQNKSAVRFYSSSGFKVISREPLDGFGKPYPILSMRWEKKGTQLNNN